MTAPEMEQTVKHVSDGALALGALTSPVWIDMVERGLGLLMLVGGVILLGLRLAIAWHEWRTRDKG